MTWILLISLVMKEGTYTDVANTYSDVLQCLEAAKRVDDVKKRPEIIVRTKCVSIKDILKYVK